MRVYYTSPWIPAEWIKAHGLEPRGIWFADKFGDGAPPLPAGVCAFAEMTVRFAEAQAESAVIFTATCDQMRRGFDAAMFHGKGRVFLFNIPATQTPVAKQIYRSELERLGEFLMEMGGHAPTAQALRREMLEAGQARHCLLEAAPGSSPRPFAEAVARFHNEGKFSMPQSTGLKFGIPLAVIGGPLYSRHWGLLDTIEAAGGRVALNATETGERSLCPAFEVDEASGNPFDALVNGYFDNMVDVFQRPNTRLYHWLKPRLRSRRVNGIVLWHFTGCDLWRAEEQTLRETFGLPVRLFEAGDGAGTSARDVNRIEAFVETLQ